MMICPFAAAHTFGAANEHMFPDTCFQKGAVADSTRPQMDAASGSESEIASERRCVDLRRFRWLFSRSSEGNFLEHCLQRNSSIGNSLWPL